MWHQGRLLLRDLHVPWLKEQPTGPPGAFERVKLHVG